MECDCREIRATLRKARKIVRVQHLNAVLCRVYVSMDRVFHRRLSYVIGNSVDRAWPYFGECMFVTYSSSGREGEMAESLCINANTARPSITLDEETVRHTLRLESLCEQMILKCQDCMLWNADCRIFFLSSVLTSYCSQISHTTIIGLLFSPAIISGMMWCLPLTDGDFSYCLDAGFQPVIHE